MIIRLQVVHLSLWKSAKKRNKHRIKSAKTIKCTPMINLLTRNSRRGRVQRAKRGKNKSKERAGRRRRSSKAKIKMNVGSLTRFSNTAIKGKTESEANNKKRHHKVSELPAQLQTRQPN